jgi:hypothetical protein
VIASVSVVLIVVFVLIVREWSKTNSVDSIHSMIQTSDGGYAMIGTSYFEAATSIEEETLWLIKTDPSGNAQWDKTYRGLNGPKGFSVIQTIDDGFVFAGSAESSNSGSYRYSLVKTDSAGNPEWNKTYRVSQHVIYPFVHADDGGYALVGTFDYYGETYFWLIKTDANGEGETLWNSTCPEIARSIVQTSDGGYALAGRGIKSTFALVKTDTGGNIDWEKEYSLPDTVSAALDVVETSDGGYVLAGNLYFSIYDDPLIAHDDLEAWEQALWMIKTDSTGNTEWDITYFGAAPGDAGSLIVTSDGGYAAAGGSYLVKTDSVGNMQWNMTYGEGVRVKSLLQTNDGGFVLAGSTSSNGGDFWLTKTDSDGKVEWTKTYGRQRYTILALAAIQVKDILTKLETKAVVHASQLIVLEKS